MNGHSFFDAGHLLKNRIDYFREALCSGGDVIKDPVI